VIVAVLMKLCEAAGNGCALARGDDTTPANWATRNKATSRRANLGMVRSQFIWWRVSTKRLHILASWGSAVNATVVVRAHRPCTARRTALARRKHHCGVLNRAAVTRGHGAKARLCPPYTSCVFTRIKTVFGCAWRRSLVGIGVGWAKRSMPTCGLSGVLARAIR
jgi:hypothetical protein